MLHRKLIYRHYYFESVEVDVRLIIGYLSVFCTTLCVLQRILCLPADTVPHLGDKEPIKKHPHYHCITVLIKIQGYLDIPEKTLRQETQTIALI